jgi:hypothetical protein
MYWKGVPGLILLVVDIGGTFTDLMGIDVGSGAVFQSKSLTTLQNLAQGVLDCVRKSGVALEAVSWTRSSPRHRGAAESDYGVVIRGSELDPVATEKRRAARRRDQS